MKTIKVPKTPRRAFNTARPAGDLLRRQAEHLEWAFRPAAQREPRAFAAARAVIPASEGEIAKYIAELTAKLMPGAAAPQSAIPPATEVTPPEPPASETARARGGDPRPRRPKAGVYTSATRRERRRQALDEDVVPPGRRRSRKAVKR